MRLDKEMECIRFVKTKIGHEYVDTLETLGTFEVDISFKDKIVLYFHVLDYEQISVANFMLVPIDKSYLNMSHKQVMQRQGNFESYNRTIAKCNLVKVLNQEDVLQRWGQYVA